MERLPAGVQGCVVQAFRIQWFQCWGIAGVVWAPSMVQVFGCKESCDYGFWSIVNPRKLEHGLGFRTVQGFLGFRGSAFRKTVLRFDRRVPPSS